MIRNQEARIASFSRIAQLLNRRVETVRRSTGAAREAKLVVGELKERLTKEMEERETEVSFFIARLVIYVYIFRDLVLKPEQPCFLFLTCFSVLVNVIHLFLP